jgi:hypothetical protein
MPGLIGNMARVAVAQGVRNRVTQRQSQRWADQGKAAPAYMAPSAGAQAAPPPPPAAAAPAEDPIAQLEKLGQLRDKGLLTDEEFQAQKAKLLA